LDTRSLAFHIINADGSLFNSTSIRGRGPGEVENLNSGFAIHNNEEIVLFDYLMRKLSFYKYSNNSLNHVRDLQLESNKSISDYFYHTSDQLIIHRSSSLSENELNQSVTLLTLNDPLKEESIFDIPKHPDLTATATQGTLNLTLNYSSKYHTRNNICAYGGAIYYNRTDSVGFTVHDLNSGLQLANYNMDVPAVLLTREEKESEVDDFIGDINDHFNSVDRDNLIADMPDIKPLVNKVICDLPDGIWMALLNEQNESTWALFSDTGQIEGILDPMPDESVISIHKGHIFTEQTDDMGDITFRAYRYSISEN
jgi:hypothetical protein